ncbi:hypothetical protein Ahy_B05g077128 [Arachis hypogaea]|uniref:GST N-terminal domain-containing protein n=1 Tax=Arachis hypogaea TaxID=3818 RepID=A0A444Z4E1_ARAHY|nr:hypothetical protein Ahy_B05g077128 [Arachis hypogaea]
MSSYSFRVRFALNLKEFLKLNPLALIPVLVDGNFVLAEYLAIIMYLDDKYPQYPLLPHDIPKRALNFQVAHIVLQNNAIEKKVGPHEKLPWAQSVIRKGFTALEKLLKDHAGRYANGDEIFLVLAIHMTMLTAPLGMNTDTIVKAKSFLDGDEDQHEKDVCEKNLKAL